MHNTATEKKQFARGSHLHVFIFAAIICLAVAAMTVMVQRSVMAKPSKPIPVHFIGEYSQNGSAWQTFEEDTRINALKGDLVLRGHFDFEKDEVPVNAYLDDIGMTVYVNGEEEFSVLNPDPYCRDCSGNQWVSWTSKAFTSESAVEIHLSNAQTVGNPKAYDDFLDQLYVGTKTALKNYSLSPSNYLSESADFMAFSGISIWTWFLQSGQFWRGIGFGIFAISLLLFGVALADSLQNKLLPRKLWLLGALSLFSVGVIVLDTPDVSLWQTNIVFYTYGAQLCRMLWFLTLSFISAEFLTGRRQMAAFAAVLLGGIFDAAVFLLFLLGKAYVTDILTPWFWFQAVIILILILACVLEIKKYGGRKHNKLGLGALLLILLSAAAELCNACFGFWQRGILLNSVFVLLLLVFGIYALMTIPGTYRTAKQVTEMENELVQNRISIMLSQIQPHFLYNSLNSIRQLCKSDPKAAQTAIEDFANYLRGNLDSIKRSTPIPFKKEMEHIRIYLALEKMRFEDELQVVWHVETDGFMLPALTVQPLVENAVKYGVGKKKGGGTVTIATAETADAYVITVSDDGVGYDPAKTQDDGRTHIGIDNVRSRLASMCSGDLCIDSAPGKGTTVIVRIPKEKY